MALTCGTAHGQCQLAWASNAGSRVAAAAEALAVAVGAHASCWTHGTSNFLPVGIPVAWALIFDAVLHVLVPTTKHCPAKCGDVVPVGIYDSYGDASQLLVLERECRLVNFRHADCCFETIAHGVKRRPQKVMNRVAT